MTSTRARPWPLEAGKNVFVEKPLALNQGEMVEVARARAMPSR